MEDKWYTYKQIIEMFGICKQTLNNWRRDGIIVYKKITHRTFLYKLPESKIIREDESSKNL
jgi:predicted site-specific integrase-resolvase